MFYQILLSPQVKRYLIINHKLVYTNCRTTQDLRSQEIRKVQDIVKNSWNYNLVPSPPSPHPENNISPITAKDTLKIEIELPQQCLTRHENQSPSHPHPPSLYLTRGRNDLYKTVSGKFKQHFKICLNQGSSFSITYYTNTYPANNNIRDYIQQISLQKN